MSFFSYKGVWILFQYPEKYIFIGLGKAKLESRFFSFLIM